MALYKVHDPERPEDEPYIVIASDEKDARVQAAYKGGPFWLKGGVVEPFKGEDHAAGSR